MMKINSDIFKFMPDQVNISMIVPEPWAQALGISADSYYAKEYSG